MKHPPVHLSWDERALAAEAMGARLRELEADVIDLCVTRVHFHALARFAPVDLDAAALALLYERLRLVAGNMLADGRDPLPRHVIGLAKKHASFELRDAGFIHERGVWAAKCKIEPIEDRAHHEHVARYVYDHKDEGGAVLSLIAPEVLRGCRGPRANAPDDVESRGIAMPRLSSVWLTARPDPTGNRSSARPAAPPHCPLQD